MRLAHSETQAKEEGPDDFLPGPSSVPGTFEQLWELLPGAHSRNPTSKATGCYLPETTCERRGASIAEQSLERDEHLSEHLPKVSARYDDEKELYPPKETVLYLAYGSNLSSKTFLGVRGIRPLSQINVIVPELRLNFDLPGLPYVEPCFAASQFRDVSRRHMDKDDTMDIGLDGDPTSENARLISLDSLPDEPLIGVVYEVSLTDYARIIATEGGGSGYQDIVVDCYAFPKHYDPADPIPNNPNTKPFKAHTLLSAATNTNERSQRANALRTWRFDPRLRQPGYAQPSARYLNLILTGAIEHNLPISYRTSLARVQTYHITSIRQKIGKAMFLVTWGPPMLLMLNLSKLLAGPDGRSPKWLVKLSNIIIAAMWGCYDNIYGPLFGDGERTIEKEGD
ncbi:hypothetical protein BBP40_003455 [Aspergillus hancockii]|nr:hypothetical protein BBP40_003455 [Aspergillus hancockii]